MISLGVRHNAAKLVGDVKSAFFLKQAQAVAMNQSRTEILLSAGPFDQINLLKCKDGAPLNEWKLKKDVVLAQTHSNSLIHSLRGTYRVDIGYGSSFVCDPAKLVGLLGVTHIQTIYTESRWDATVIGVSKAWNFTALHSQNLASAFVQFLRNVPWPRYLHQLSLPRIQLPGLPQTIDKYWLLVLRHWKTTSAYVRRAIYYKTHPRRYIIEGPGSVLLKA